MSDRTYQGIVTNVDDPERLGRIKFSSIGMLEGKEHPRWAVPTFPSRGYFVLPKVGEKVDIFLERGSIQRPRWKATVYDSSGPPPSEALEVYPLGATWGRDSGYVLVDDKNETIGVYHKKSGMKVLLDSNEVLLGASSGHLKLMNENLESWLNSHTHSGVQTGGGVSGPPGTMVPSNAKTTNVKAT